VVEAIPGAVAWLVWSAEPQVARPLGAEERLLVWSADPQLARLLAWSAEPQEADSAQAPQGLVHA
jgi:hypothetical protein